MTRWEREEVFHDGDAYFASMLESIARATRTIDLESYIFKLDSLGDRVLAALKDASRRGVRVRLLVDGAGSAGWTYRWLEHLGKRGIEARIYHPLPWQRRHSFWKTLANPLLVLSSLGKLNRRNHRKTCLIDGRIADVGGMNVMEEHSREARGNKAWRDSGVRVEGPEIKVLEEAFEAAWNQTLPKLNPRGWKRTATRGLVRMNHQPKLRRVLYRDTLKRILNAQERVWITSPYFVPDLTLIWTLRFVSWSGVDTRLLVPRVSDVPLLNWANRAYYASLLHAGVRIYEYLPSTLHAKVMIIDDWVTVGSSNLNHRSLIHDLEADVVLTHDESKRRVKAQYLEDLRQSCEVNVASWKKRPWFHRWIEKLVLKMRYWM